MSQEGTYDYVFSGPLDSQALSSTLKLTSPPVRVRPDDDGRSSTGTRHSPGSGLKRPRYIGDGTGSLGSRKSDRCDGEDAESLRQLLIE
uniref:Uncharacterized protein n=1 Tax=Anopheles stephensi TaxID=30069 RepID=A0A182XYL7_ANOST